MIRHDFILSGFKNYCRSEESHLSVFIESQRTTPAASGLVLWVFRVHPGGFPFSFLTCV